MNNNERQCDVLVSFMFDDVAVRGAWVSVKDSLLAMPALAAAECAGKILLGESVAAATLLSANIKLEGRLALQARGKGALKLLVAESTQDAGVRGVIELDAGAVKHAPDGLPALVDLVGDGYLAVTLLPDSGESYQGIVPLQGKRLQDCLTDYFRQSEQLETALWLTCDGERAAGLLLQVMPGADAGDEGWQHLRVLADTISDEELLSLSCEDLLRRLFHQEAVRVFDAVPVAFRCTCSAERSDAALAALGRDDLHKLFVEQPVVNVDCRFCGAVYRYTERDAGRVLGETPPVLH